MKILVKTYLNGNLGDDLFLHILFTRYPDISFEIHPPHCCMEFYRHFAAFYENVQLSESESVIYRTKRRLGITDIDRRLFRHYDGVVHISGSVFAENMHDRTNDILFSREIDFLSRRRIPVFVLSCNFGPYYTDEYKARKERAFAKCTDICFRDRYSYNLFKELPNVRYAPDAGFTLSICPPQKTSGSTGISVIDLKSRPALSEYADAYGKTVLNIAKKQLDSGGRVRFFSFCTNEGDTDAAKDFISELNRMGYTDNISLAVYNGNVESFVIDFMAMEQTVCTRFHAMVIAALCGQKYFPVVYSDKLSNVISDLGLCTNYAHINGKSDIACGINSADIEKVKAEAQGMFIRLDEFLK